MYTLINVGKRYGTNLVLKSITCELPLDGLLAIMGPSGAGKSTLLRLLAFLETPDVGDLHLQLGKTRFGGRNKDRPWPNVTLVFQKQFLWPHLTLRENIVLPLRAEHHVNVRSKLEAVVERFEMSSFVDRYPNEVSAGQAQRGALARAFVLDPKVILLDEAHFGLDLEQQEILNQHLTALRKSGVGLIVVTHSLDFVRKYAGRILVIEDGSLAEFGDRMLLTTPASQYLRRAIGLSGCPHPDHRRG